MISRNNRREIQDVRVRRGPDIGSDHYMVIAKTQIGCRNTHKIYVGHWNLEPIWIKECAYADDLVIFANIENDLKRNLEI